MHIGIDASRATSPERTGTEAYSLHLLRHLLALDGRNRYTLYFNRPAAPGILPRDVHCQWRVMPFPRLWTHLRLSWEMALHPPDLLFVPSHVLPLVHPARSVVTIHDLGYLYYPEAYPAADWHYLHLSTAYNARFSSHIIADSEATKKDILKWLGVPAEKVTVIYPGVGEEFRPLADGSEIEALKARYGVGGGYLLYVGTLQPRKNLARLLEAYAKARHQGAVQEKLLLAGRPGWNFARLYNHLHGQEGDVVLSGFFPSEDLPLLYAGATAFLFPSLFEGFGIPVLEAMASGTPVMAARAASLPEVVGDAALLVDPLDVEGMAEAICRLVRDQELRTELSRKGLEQAGRFTWRRAAEQILDVLERAG